MEAKITAAHLDWKIDGVGQKLKDSGEHLLASVFSTHGVVWRASVASVRAFDKHSELGTRKPTWPPGIRTATAAIGTRSMWPDPAFVKYRLVLKPTTSECVECRISIVAFSVKDDEKWKKLTTYPARTVVLGGPCSSLDPWSIPNGSLSFALGDEIDEAIAAGSIVFRIRIDSLVAKLPSAKPLTAPRFFGTTPNAQLDARLDETPHIFGPAPNSQLGSMFSSAPKLFDVEFLFDGLAAPEPVKAHAVVLNSAFPSKTLTGTRHALGFRVACPAGVHPEYARAMVRWAYTLPFEAPEHGIVAKELHALSLFCTKHKIHWFFLAFVRKLMKTCTFPKYAATVWLVVDRDGDMPLLASECLHLIVKHRRAVFNSAAYQALATKHPDKLRALLENCVSISSLQCDAMREELKVATDAAMRPGDKFATEKDKQLYDSVIQYQKKMESAPDTCFGKRARSGPMNSMYRAFGVRRARGVSGSMVL